MRNKTALSFKENHRKSKPNHTLLKERHYGAEFFQWYNRRCEHWGSQQIKVDELEDEVLIGVSACVKKILIDSLKNKAEVHFILPLWIKKKLWRHTNSVSNRDKEKTIIVFCAVIDHFKAFFLKGYIQNLYDKEAGSDSKRPKPGPSGHATLKIRP